MRATIFYITTSRAQDEAINREGWSLEIGRAYLTAKDGDRGLAEKHGMVLEAAFVDAKFDAAEGDRHAACERIWTCLQNGVPHAPIDVVAVLQRTRAGRRSMDVGDFIVWEDGQVDRVASMGFVTELRRANGALEVVR